MQMAELNGITVHYADQGDPNGAAVVFSNSLGTDFRLWDQLMPYLPKGLRLIRYDTRGHGLTGAPDGDYFMGDLVGDAAALLDHLGVKNCIFVGLSIGGMIAQGLAAERLDLVRGLVLSNTAAKIGTTAMWQDRMEAVRKGGIAALEAGILERWLSPRWRRENPVELAGWRHMLCRTPVDGYLGCSAAIAETDLFDSTARLTLPTLAIAGSEDGSTPPDLVRETADLMKGSKFHLIRGAGHLPCVEQPQEYAAVLTTFLEEQGHV
ncbi:3-oxoadipate enol-lactonase [Profundibacter sp.]|uniref:3-oxoadipate enol-lactonase n=1 Tax=Profundibacter sp. TaxID=3101071 RepID=UPI003D0EBAE6